MPIAPLGYVLLTGAIDMETSFAPGDFRANTSRMDPSNRADNLAVVELAQIWGQQKGVKPGQIALSWLLAQSNTIVPIPGTTQVQHLLDNIAAAKISFITDELEAFTASLNAIEIKGTRAPQLVADWSDVEAPDV